jgi:hypothetical protein
MPSSTDLIKRREIWQKDLAGRLDRLHRAATEAEAAYADAEARDDIRSRRASRRRARLSEQYGVGSR